MRLNNKVTIITGAGTGIGEAIALADEVIINSGSVEELTRSVSELFERLKKTSVSTNQESSSTVPV